MTSSHSQRRPIQLHVYNKTDVGVSRPSKNSIRPALSHHPEEPLESETAQSIFAAARLLTAGLARLLARRTAGRLYLLCFLRRLRATMTGTEDFVTR